MDDNIFGALENSQLHSLRKEAEKLHELASDLAKDVHDTLRADVQKVVTDISGIRTKIDAVLVKIDLSSDQKKVEIESFGRILSTVERAMKRIERRNAQTGGTGGASADEIRQLRDTIAQIEQRAAAKQSEAEKAINDQRDDFNRRLNEQARERERQQREIEELKNRQPPTPAQATAGKPKSTPLKKGMFVPPKPLKIADRLAEIQGNPMHQGGSRALLASYFSKVTGIKPTASPEAKSEDAKAAEPKEQANQPEKKVDPKKEEPKEEKEKASGKNEKAGH